MRSPFFRLVPLLAIALVSAIVAPAVVHAAGAAPTSGLAVRDGWVRWLPGGLPAAGYLTIRNDSDAERIVTGVASGDFARVMLHESYSEPGGGSRMRPVDRLRVPARGNVALKPGGYHLMLMKPRRKLTPGDVVQVALTFDDGATIEAKLPLKPAAQTE